MSHWESDSLCLGLQVLLIWMEVMQRAGRVRKWGDFTCSTSFNGKPSSTDLFCGANGKGSSCDYNTLLKSSLQREVMLIRKQLSTPDVSKSWLQFWVTKICHIGEEALFVSLFGGGMLIHPAFIWHLSIKRCKLMKKISCLTPDTLRIGNALSSGNSRAFSVSGSWE